MEVLRRKVDFCTLERGVGVVRKFGGGSKVNQLDPVSSRVVEDVLVLDVSVINSDRDEVETGIQQLVQDIPGILHSQSSVCRDVVEQIQVVRKVLHHDDPVILLVEDLRQVQEVGVIQGFRQDDLVRNQGRSVFAPALPLASGVRDDLCSVEFSVRDPFHQPDSSVSSFSELADRLVGLCKGCSRGVHRCRSRRGGSE